MFYNKKIFFSKKNYKNNYIICFLFILFIFFIEKYQNFIGYKKYLFHH